jgi:hypothetical protein
MRSYLNLHDYQHSAHSSSSSLHKAGAFSCTKAKVRRLSQRLGTAFGTQIRQGWSIKFFLGHLHSTFYIQKLHVILAWRGSLWRGDAGLVWGCGGWGGGVASGGRRSGCLLAPGSGGPRRGRLLMGSRGGTYMDRNWRAWRRRERTLLALPLPPDLAKSPGVPGLP